MSTIEYRSHSVIEFILWKDETPWQVCDRLYPGLKLTPNHQTPLSLGAGKYLKSWSVITGRTDYWVWLVELP